MNTTTQRIIALFNYDFHFSFKSFIKVMSVISLFFILILFLGSYRNGIDEGQLLGFYFGSLFIGGLIYSSIAFHGINEVQGRTDFLKLPGKAWEKLLVKWIYSGIGVTIFLTGIYLMLSFIFLPLIDAIFKVTYEPLDLTNKDNLTVIGVYLIIQTIFLFASIYFNKGSFPKIILSFIVLFITIVFINAILFRIFNADLFDSLFTIAQPSGITTIDTHDQFDEMVWVRFLKIAFYTLVPTLFLVLSYFSIKEKQV